MKSLTGKKPTEKSPDVFAFTDYRAYLRAYAQHKKKCHHGWSLTVWARQLGVASRSTLSMVLSGSRDPSMDLVANIVRVLDLSKSEAVYFETLVRHGKSRNDPSLRLVLTERINRLNPRIRTRADLIDFKTFEAISHWYYYAIREMVRLDDFIEDPQWIADRLAFKLGHREIRRAITNLVSLGLLARDGEGRLKQSTLSITTEDDVSKEAIKNFHEQVLDRSKEAVRKFGVDERNLSAVTFTCSKDKLAEAKAMIRRFEDELIEFMQDGKGEVTMQLATQLFPYTKAIESKRIEDCDA